jgi:hypothetical protein
MTPTLPAPYAALQRFLVKPDVNCAGRHVGDRVLAATVFRTPFPAHTAV